MSENNQALANIFDEIATIYEFLGFENRFRVRAYRKASYVLANMTEDISEHLPANNLEKVPGVGASLAAKICEYLETGKIKKHQDLRKKVPHDFIDLLKVKGLGPETLKTLHLALNINTKQDLMRALRDGRVARLPGFKEKKVMNLLRGLELRETLEKRILLWDALELGAMVMDYLKKLPEVQKVELAGSIRRRQETIGDLDILIMSKDKDRKKIINHFLSWEQIQKVLVQGSKKVSVLLRARRRQVDLRLFKRKEWGAGLLYFTGNKEHNIHLRKVAIEQGWKINEYGLYEISSGKRLAGRTEKEIYNQLGLSWIPPEIRLDRGEITLAEEHKLPVLIKLEDIKGDMQLHSNWSDGTQTIEELANFVLHRYNYRYIVITDHSKTSRVARGLNEEQFRSQIDTIKLVNQKLGIDFVKSGAEVDILPDGSLDLSDDLLQNLDWVVAGIHSRFEMDNTQRLVKACRHPLVCAIAHPTGRIIGQRQAYTLDTKILFETAATTNTALEINAQPHRMDLKDSLVIEARKKGVKLVINTDSHRARDFDYMHLGVAIARRACCSKEHILNTRSWEDLEKFKVAKSNSQTIRRI